MTLRRPRISSSPVATFLLLVGAMAAPTQAAYVTYGFSGTVTTLTDSTNVLGGAIRLGDRYSGTVTFETTARGNTLAPGVASYLYIPSSTTNALVNPVGMTVKIGSYTIETDYRTISSSLRVLVGNNAATTLGVNADVFESQLTSYTDRSTSAAELVTIISLADRTQQALSSTALPTAVSTSMFTDGMFSVSTYLPGSSTATQLLSGTVDNLASGAIPEPASLALTSVGVALAALAGRRQQRRRRRSVR